MIQASERAAQLTNQMLAYSGRGRFVVEPLNLSEQVRQITALVQSSIPKGVKLLLNLDSNLPNTLADPAQIQQLVMNLVINGAEAMASQGGTLEVSTGTRATKDEILSESVSGAPVRPGNYIVLTVRDEGSGIDSATKSKLFAPFFTTKFTGRGLGLAAALGIVRAHHGGITLQNSSRTRNYLSRVPACVRTGAPGR